MTDTLTRPVSLTPDRSHAQRLDALARANEIRVRRARLKVDIKAGRVPVTPLVADPPDWLRTMRVAELIIALPNVGRVKVSRLLQHHHVSLSKTLGGLSDRQRTEIVRALRARGA